MEGEAGCSGGADDARQHARPFSSWPGLINRPSCFQRAPRLADDESKTQMTTSRLSANAFLVATAAASAAAVYDAAAPAAGAASAGIPVHPTAATAVPATTTAATAAAKAAVRSAAAVSGVPTAAAGRRGGGATGSGQGRCGCVRIVKAVMLAMIDAVEMEVAEGCC